MNRGGRYEIRDGQRVRVAGTEEQGRKQPAESKRKQKVSKDADAKESTTGKD
jgi:hypothetical protein